MTATEMGMMPGECGAHLKQESVLRREWSTLSMLLRSKIKTGKYQI